MSSSDTASTESLTSPRSPLSFTSDENDKENRSIGSNQNRRYHGHHQQLSPLLQRDFYRDPVEVPRSAYQYEVCALSRLRAAYDMQSAPLTELPHGTVVSVEEIWSNRARISSPVCGWLSVYSLRGEQLLMPLDANAAKIGGRIVFKNEQNEIEFGKVTGYDHHCGLHAVTRERIGLQWVSLTDPNLQFIGKQQAQRPTSQAATVHGQKAFVSECLSVDYPSMSPSFPQSVYAEEEEE